MNTLGLDIGAKQIKTAELSHEPDQKPILVNYSVMPSPPKPLASDDPEVLDNYVAELKDLFDTIEMRADGVVASLPEDKAFSQVIHLPQMEEKDLKSAISFEAGEYLPIPLEEANFSWQVVGNSTDAAGKSQLDILLVAAPKVLVKRYTDVLERVGLKIMALESEASALARLSALSGNEDVTSLIANIGDSSTSVAISAGGDVRFSRSISTGGSSLTKALSQGLGFAVGQAEEYKRTYGLDETQLEGRVAKALQPVFNIIVEEMRKAAEYYNSLSQGAPVKRVILCGGSARLPGALPFVASSLSLEAEILDPWQSLEGVDKFPAAELDELGSSLAVAVGLALRER